MSKKKKDEIIEEVSEEIEDMESEEIVETEDEEVETEESQEEEPEEEKDDMNTKLLRLQADFINYKNRADKEKTRIYSSAVEDVVCEMLTVLDNFERALEAPDDNGSFKEGVQMIFDQFKQTLEKRGLEEIDALGATFDPAMHHGVMSEEVEGTEADIVLEVLQKGYKIKEKIIRPSMVKVSR
ncbi:molecular chaperone GrpE [Dethiosulfatibacter aminovorans DSM 17477]|uniref:Protein GrpE n=1 Tax=Dethiosulfatibacter aminovorans DSM 17477 TaxID=1121476 RepID=A0A1M6DV06_9FIRM|nr:nucleotide exchange factor GrpE [Dethiosulfatibacter aminovorans]SHI76858.1 molecular chaperone GrpE [Dethiosulfatibacter aminovorans DSM 17477]